MAAALKLAAALLLTGCWPPSELPPGDAASVVVLLGADHLPACSAFATRDVMGRRVLVTAAHCVTYGDTPHYVTWAQWRYTASDSTAAQLLTLDTDNDRAALAAPVGLPLLPRGARPLPGARLHAVSALYGWSTVDGEALNSREASLTVLPGWSGSPVIDADGRAVGVVIGCDGTKLEAGLRTITTCRPGWALFAGLP